MKNLFKRFLSLCPSTWEQEIRRLYFGYQVKRNVFESREKECDFLSDIVSEGDFVIDVGANIGHYTAKLSRIVGIEGRVFAFEPIPETFQILCSNVNFLPYKNVTLINAAVSKSTGIGGMQIPKFDTGLSNYYMAHLTKSTNVGKNDTNVFFLSIDSLKIQEKIKLVKIDAEGFDYEVLLGMTDLIKRDLPTIIVEEKSNKIFDFLNSFGYSMKFAEGSQNLLFNPLKIEEKQNKKKTK